jgi:predicted amidohydrolase
MSRKLKIAALQKRVGSHIPPAMFERMHEAGVDIVCLPEYFFIPDGARNQVETADQRQLILSQLEAYSRSLAGVVVGGSLVEKAGDGHFNTCHIFDSGRHVGYYRKRHLTARERAVGLSPGERPAVFGWESSSAPTFWCGIIFGNWPR